MDMAQEGKGNKAVRLSEKKDVVTATCMATNKEAEDSNAMVNDSSAAVVCNFSYTLYFLPMRIVHNHCYIHRRPGWKKTTIGCSTHHTTMAL
jgi:hypothetical protein